MSQRRRSENHAPLSWKEIKMLMRKHFVSRGFHKLQTLKQGSKSVNTYYQKLLLLLEEVNTYEEKETIMDRFYSGFSEKIVDMLADQEKIDLIRTWKKWCMTPSR